MIRWILILLILSVFAARAGGTPEPCSADWNRYVDEELVSGDGQGHGPDLGSDEWKGVIEFKLGVRGQPEVPPRDSVDWCVYIDHLVSER
jgi:hypothetical protein